MNSKARALAALPLVLFAAGCLNSNYSWSKGLSVGGDIDIRGMERLDWDGRVIVELGELLLQPVLFVLDVITLRPLWDHASFPMSGLCSMLLRLLALLPGYVHADPGGLMLPGILAGR